MRKVAPVFPETAAFHPDNSYTAEKDMAAMKEWGFNAVRLGVYWPGMEPHPGQFNTTYFDQVIRSIQDAATHGIHTVIDLQQDAFSPLLCGNGSQIGQSSCQTTSKPSRIQTIIISATIPSATIPRGVASTHGAHM